VSTPASAEAALVAAHIEAQARLRTVAAAAAAGAWTGLPGYDAADVARFLALVVPLVRAAQRQSVALTAAYLARAIDRPVFGVDAANIIESVRGGVPAGTVYRRPFVTVWSALGDHTPYEDAVAQGLHRVTSSVATDVQLAMTHTLREVGESQDLILGYRRVPDAGACAFCVLVAGRRYLTSDLMEIHNRCGCGVSVVTAANRGDFTGKRENDLALPAGVAVHAHGELGPVLGSPDDAFTSASDF
jgi:hypothetical protein